MPQLEHNEKDLWAGHMQELCLSAWLDEFTNGSDMIIQATAE